jgi:hypothetical protein
METGEFRLLVMVPHRDIRLPLRAWSGSLFAAGVAGAWSFPWVMPIAQLDRPLAAEELKAFARALRQEINKIGGKLTAEAPVQSVLFDEVSVYGPSLPLNLFDNFYETISGAIVRRFSPLVLGAALLCGPLPEGLPAPPLISFRAAALANMNCRFSPLGDDGKGGHLAEWKMGKLSWLPRMKNKKEKNEQWDEEL